MVSSKAKVIFLLRDLGKMIYPRTSKIDWHEGDFMGGVCHGDGRQKMRNGMIFEGKFENGKREGKGTIEK